MAKRPTAARSSDTIEHLPVQRVVAFIDILGFRALVSKMRGDSELFGLVRDALSSVEADALRHAENADASLQQAHFSDTVVYSAELDCSRCPSISGSMLRR